MSERTNQSTNPTEKKKLLTAKNLTLIALFGAISAVLMLLEFPIPLAPGFIKMDFSELPVILGGFMMGPLAGIYIILIKIILKLVLNGTMTMGTGEAANMLCSISYMLPAVLLYHKLHTKKGAIVSLLVGTLTVSVMAILVDCFLIFPVYSVFMGVSMEQIVGMGTATNPLVHDMFTLVIAALLPFNLFKYTLVSAITFLVYKRLKATLRIGK